MKEKAKEMHVPQLDNQKRNQARDEYVKRQLNKNIELKAIKDLIIIGLFK